MSEKTLQGQMEDKIKHALSTRNELDDKIRDIEQELRRAKSGRSDLTEQAFRLRKSLWALEGKTGADYTDDHATGENDKQARAIREANSR